jgi:hypothetical protein
VWWGVGIVAMCACVYFSLYHSCRFHTRTFARSAPAALSARAPAPRGMDAGALEALVESIMPAVRKRTADLQAKPAPQGATRSSVARSLALLLEGYAAGVTLAILRSDVHRAVHQGPQPLDERPGPTTFEVVDFSDGALVLQQEGDRGGGLVRHVPSERLRALLPPGLLAPGRRLLVVGGLLVDARGQDAHSLPASTQPSAPSPGLVGCAAPLPASSKAGADPPRVKLQLVLPTGGGVALVLDPFTSVLDLQLLHHATGARPTAPLSLPAHLMPAALARCGGVSHATVAIDGGAPRRLARVRLLPPNDGTQQGPMAPWYGVAGLGRRAPAEEVQLWDADAVGMRQILHAGALFALFGAEGGADAAPPPRVLTYGSRTVMAIVREKGARGCAGGGGCGGGGYGSSGFGHGGCGSSGDAGVAVAGRLVRIEDAGGGLVARPEGGAGDGGNSGAAGSVRLTLLVGVPSRAAGGKGCASAGEWPCGSRAAGGGGGAPAAGCGGVSAEVARSGGRSAEAHVARTNAAGFHANRTHTPLGIHGPAAVHAPPDVHSSLLLHVVTVHIALSETSSIDTSTPNAQTASAQAAGARLSAALGSLCVGHQVLVTGLAHEGAENAGVNGTGVNGTGVNNGPGVNGACVNAPGVNRVGGLMSEWLEGGGHLVAGPCNGKAAGGRAVTLRGSSASGITLHNLSRLTCVLRSPQLRTLSPLAAAADPAVGTISCRAAIVSWRESTRAGGAWQGGDGESGEGESWEEHGAGAGSGLWFQIDDGACGLVVWAGMESVRALLGQGADGAPGREAHDWHRAMLGLLTTERLWALTRGPLEGADAAPRPGGAGHAPQGPANRDGALVREGWWQVGAVAECDS